MGVNTNGVQTGLQNARRETKSFKSALTKLGPILAAVGLAGLGRAALKLGSDLNDTSRQLNVSVEGLQALQRSARSTGASVSDLSRALVNVQTRSRDAANGNKTLSEAFGRLNINLGEFTKLSPEKQMEELAKAQANAADSGQAYRDIATVLGERAGPKLQGVLDELASVGFDGVKKSAMDAGQVMSADAAKAMDDLTNMGGDLRNRFVILTAEITKKMLPVLGALVQGWGVVSDTFKAFMKIVGSTGELIGSFIFIAIQPLVQGLRTMGLFAQSAWQALTGDFSEARKTFAAARESASELGETLKNTAGEALKAFDEFGKSAAEAGSELFNNIADRGDEFDKIWEKLMDNLFDNTEEGFDRAGDAAEGFGNRVESAGIDAESALNRVRGRANAVGSSLRSAREEAERLLAERRAQLTQDLDNATTASQTLEQAMREQRQAIGDLFRENLLKKMAEEYGVSLDRATTEYERLFERVSRRIGGFTRQDQINAMQEAIRNIRQEVRQDGGVLPPGSIIPSKEETEQLLQALSRMRAQTDALQEAPQHISDLIKQYEEMKEQHSDLLDSRDVLIDEIDSLDSAMDSVADVLEEKAQEIRDISFDPDNDSSGIKEIRIENFDKAVDFLQNIDTTLQGKFVNE